VLYPQRLTEEPLRDIPDEVLFTVVHSGNVYKGLCDFVETQRKVKGAETTPPGKTSTVEVLQYHVAANNGGLVVGVTKSSAANIPETERFALAMIEIEEFNALSTGGIFVPATVRAIKTTSAEARVNHGKDHPVLSGLDSFQKARGLPAVRVEAKFGMALKGEFGQADGLQMADFFEGGATTAQTLMTTLSMSTSLRLTVELLVGLRDFFTGVFHERYYEAFEVVIRVLTGRDLVSSGSVQDSTLPLPLYPVAVIAKLAWHLLTRVIRLIRDSKPAYQGDPSFEFSSPAKCVAAVAEAIQSLIGMSTSQMQTLELAMQATCTGDPVSESTKEKQGATKQAKKPVQVPASSPTVSKPAAVKSGGSPPGRVTPTGEYCIKTIGHVMIGTPRNFCDGRLCKGAKHIATKTEAFGNVAELERYLTKHATAMLPERKAAILAGYTKG
jgi:hypothetical protein